MKPLVSIVIPTKNRYKYLRQCIDSLLIIKKLYPVLFEIVIQDNSDDNTEILNYIEGVSDFVIYNYERMSISVVENSDRAILSSSGEYVSFIGDDDSVTKQIIDVAKWMKENEIDAVVGTIARYNWPDLVSAYHKLHSVVIPYYSIDYKIVNTKDIAKKVLSIGAHSLLNLPKVYHGMVSRKTLDTIYNITGSFFPGPSPDMANAIALAYVVNKYAIIGTPFIVSGFSYKSAGGMGARHAHLGKVEEMTFLPNGTAENWESMIPKYWTGPTIYAESALKSLKRMGLDAEIKKFNHSASYAAFVMYNWNGRNTVKKFLNLKNIAPFLCHCLCITTSRGWAFLNNILMSKLKITKNFVTDAACDLPSAVKIVETQYLKARK